MLEIIEIGPHRLINADITNLGEMEDFLRSQDIDIIYSDPPWGPGNLKYWRTMNKEKTSPDWGIFLNAFTELCRLARRHIFIEMGTRFKNELHRAIEKHGIHPKKVWEVYYGNPKRPLTLSWFPIEHGAKIQDMGNKHGERYTYQSLKAVAGPGYTVFDPCCGKGMTAKFSAVLDMHFVGIELNRERLEKTIEILKKIEANKPKYKRKFEKKYGVGP